jgi:hypothetical protein
VLGPAHLFTDPVTPLPNFTGAHSSQVARVEPIPVFIVDVEETAKDLNIYYPTVKTVGEKQCIIRAHRKVLDGGYYKRQSAAATCDSCVRFVHLRDMKAESEELAKFIFPQLRKLCESRGVICRELGDKAGLSLSLGNQGITRRKRGDLDGAMELLKEQERISRELSDGSFQYSDIGRMTPADLPKVQAAAQRLREAVNQLKPQETK